ncbi:MAG: thioredoxin [Hadesarchaea archaeon]|nr:MAG: thioredoxin [Hadesarchaea archaeon]
MEDEELARIRERKLKELEERWLRGRKMGTEGPVEVTEENFDEFIRANPRVVVDFWAAWCPPCRLLSPVVEELAKKYAGRVVFGKLNVDENPSVAQRFGIMSIPTLLYFKEGKLVDETVGALPASVIEERIKRLL